MLKSALPFDEVTGANGVTFAFTVDVRRRGVERVVGRQGRVTGRIGPGLVGEVMVPIRGGVEAFYAHPTIPDEEIPVGTIIIVVEYSPPRTVYVARAIV
ncbi:hypothetical protein [Sphaerisporangium corydalis]|uniref:Uncharacterized protein n=1 Tax=Sphaerisporangium corydalis TaxID=1441875 RepID=A0ABV9ERV0_9ACTN|nr:hypothetical protein [Sphaerisporangium corydalis]